MPKRNCIVCGIETDGYRYCGKKCIATAKRTRNTKSCVKCGGVCCFRAISCVACTRAKNLSNWIHNCANCGKSFEAKRGMNRKIRFCSVACANAGIRLSRPITKNPKPEKPVLAIACGVCGCEFATTHSRRVYCSWACRHKQKGKQSTQKAKVARLHKQKGCIQCGSVFTNASSQSSLYCCRGCYRQSPKYRNVIRTARARRRARLRMLPHESVKPSDVFNRDGWACVYCGCAVVDYRLGGKLPSNGATLDHVVPLAKGGSHVMANLATACSSCNTRKGAASAGEFACVP